MLYTWDWRNMLVQVSSSQSPVTSYEYDGDGNRISKTQGEETTKYINDVALPLVQVLFETTDEDTVIATYTYGNDLIAMNRAGVSSYYQYDGLGSVRQLTDIAGSVTTSYTYDAFGNLIASSGATTNAYGFTGEQQFGEADNLVFLRARYYSPSMGRFINRDPIGVAGGINLYAYVGNNPINYLDPIGLGKCGDAYEEDKLDCVSELKTPPPMGWIKYIICMGKAQAKYYICIMDVLTDPNCGEPM